MNDRRFDTDAARFEPWIGQLLRDYAVMADTPFDPIAVASAAATAAPRIAPWAGRRGLFGPSLRTAALALLLLGMLAALLGGALVLGLPDLPVPVIPSGPRFGAGEVVVTIDGQIMRIDLATGRRSVVADGWVLAMSPDRTRVLRATTTANPEGWPGSSGYLGPLAITDAAGTDMDQVLPGAWVASWSPDGRYLALEGLFTDESHYAVWDTQQESVTYLPFTRHPNLILRPTWAPDSQHLLVMDGWGSVITDLTGRIRQPVVEGASGLMYWSPDGRYILRDPNPGLFGGCCLSPVNMRRTGTIGGPCCQSLRAVNPDFTSREVGLVPLVPSPSWSPDSRHYAGVTPEGIVVVSLDHPGQSWVLYQADADDPRQRLPAQFVEWSPDSRQIAFVGRDPTDAVRVQRYALLTVDAVGSGGVRVIATLDEPPPPGAVGLLNW
jgi:hypothetical protein